MKPFELNNRIQNWYLRYLGVFGPLSWIPQMILTCITIPLSLIVWFFVDLRDAKKDRARMREDIKGGTQ